MSSRLDNIARRKQALIAAQERWRTAGAELTRYDGWFLAIAIGAAIMFALAMPIEAIRG